MASSSSSTPSSSSQTLAPPPSTAKHSISSPQNDFHDKDFYLDWFTNKNKGGLYTVMLYRFKRMNVIQLHDVYIMRGRLGMDWEKATDYQHDIKWLYREHLQNVAKGMIGPKGSANEEVKTLAKDEVVKVVRQQVENTITQTVVNNIQEQLTNETKEAVKYIQEEKSMPHQPALIVTPSPPVKRQFVRKPQAPTVPLPELNND